MAQFFLKKTFEYFSALLLAWRKRATDVSLITATTTTSTTTCNLFLKKKHFLVNFRPKLFLFRPLTSLSLSLRRVLFRLAKRWDAQYKMEGGKELPFGGIRGQRTWKTFGCHFRCRHFRCLETNFSGKNTVAKLFSKDFVILWKRKTRLTSSTFAATTTPQKQFEGERGGGGTERTNLHNLFLLQVLNAECNWHKEVVLWFVPGLTNL